MFFLYKIWDFGRGFLVFLIYVVLRAGRKQFGIFVGVYLFYFMYLVLGAGWPQFGKVLSTVRRCNIPVSIFFNLTQFSSLKFHYYVFQNNPQKTTFMYCYASLNSEYNTLWPFWRMFPHPLYIMYYLVYFFMLFWNGLPITNILISK